MNYDAQQYAFSHGMATTPQLHLQQHQLHQQQQQQHFKQQQQIFQQQYNQAVPTSNVYQFHFARGGNPVNPIFQQKDAHPMDIPGSMQPRMAQHSLVPQPFIKHGVSAGIDGSSVHVLGSLNGMIYSQQKNNVKIITNPDGRIMQQPEGAARMQQALVGVDMMGNSNFMEQSLDPQQQQHQGMRVAGQGNVFTYNKQHFSGWLPSQQINAPSTAQHTPGCQSTLPSFSHVWSQFPHQKQINVLHHQQLQQHINQYQQPQQLQHHLQHQEHQQLQAQQQFTAPGFQALPGIQVIKMHQQKPQQISVPASVQTAPHLPQQLNCFSPCQPNLVSPGCTDKDIQDTERGMHCVERGITVSSQAVHSLACTQPVSSCGEHQPSTAVTYTVSGPPKVTVTLDSLTHSETFSPDQFLGRSDGSFNADSASPNFIKDKAVRLSDNFASSGLSENCPLQPQQEWQILQNQRNTCPPKPLLHAFFTGSSYERSSSESSSFSSPPYTFTPPSSMDSMFSPVHTQFSKAVAENSSGRTSALSSSSSLMSSSSSPSVAMRMSSWPGSQSTTSTVPTVTTASSVASSTCTTSTPTVVFSCNTVAITTTSVTSTTPSPKESVASAHSGMPLSSISSCISETHSLSCSPVHRSSASVIDTGTDKKVKIPYSWHRKFENGIIVYLSPSGTVLQSFDQICRYLLSDNTCKCGLECPIQVEKFFNFDPEVESQPWTASSGGENLRNLCNHRREIVALAAFHSSQAEAAVTSADQALEMGKKRERKKSFNAGEGLIVAPLKRLKTSITNAVNKHALTVGSSTLHSSTAVNEKPPALNMSLSFSVASESPLESKGSCTNRSDFLCQASNPMSERFDCQRSHCGMGDNEKMLSGNVQGPSFSDPDDSKQGVFLHQQFHGSRQTHNVNSGPHTFMPVESNLVFHQGHGRESVTGMPSHYSLDSGFQGSQHQMRYPQTQLSHSHHQQPTDPGMFFPQTHVYPNLTYVTQQRPQGFHPGIWQDGSANGPTVMSHPHHHPPRPYPPNVNFQHSNFSHSHPGTFPKHSAHNQQAFGNPSLDSKKAKSKRPKSKKDKQKQVNSIVDRSSPCSKALTKTAVIPSTSASFFGNPIVFVEQQTAIINNSIASCHIACPTPSPPRSELVKPMVVTYQPLKDTDCESKTVTPHKDTEPVRNPSLEDLDKNKSIEKDEEEDRKTGTDLDSNKSFSDATENNDSAYLSQTGSDQERSDTADGLDSCLEATSKLSDIYYFNSSEKQKGRQNVDLSSTEKTSSELKICVVDSLIPKNAPAKKKKAIQELAVVSSKSSSIVTKVQENKKTSKPKPRQRTTQAKKDLLAQDFELLKKNLPSSLNGDLSLLLSSNNWNIPALQQVLAQYSGGDPGHLNAVIQHILSQAMVTGADFPASNLLSAAARAQLNLKPKEQNPTPLPHGLNSPVLQNPKTENVSASGVSSPSFSDSKAAIVSTGVCGTIVSSVITQQPQFQQVRKGASLVRNMMQFQQLPSGNFAMNMLLPTNGQGQAYVSDSVRTGTYNTDSDLKSAQGTVNPLMAQGILATLSQTGDLGSQIKLPLASVIPTSLGPNVAQCSPDSNTMLLNNFGPRMIMNAPVPPVSVSVVTNVTKSLTQVVPAISINQTVFSTQQLLGAQQNAPQIISTGAAAPGTHIINTQPHGAQLVTAAHQGTQFVNPTIPTTQLVGNTPQTSQIVNALSVQGLNNQLLIANPIQQVSPSNSISQLSPAVAAQILAQGHQQLQQMSPSFLQNQLHKQNSVVNNQNIFASVSLPTLTASSGSTDVIASSLSQAGIIGGNIQKNPRAGDTLCKMDVANSISQVKDTAASLGNTSVYAASSQPVFVIPQPSTNSVMQMLGTAQSLNATSGLATDLNVQQGNLSQIFGQSAAIDQSQFQNLLTSGFNPLAMQQMVNAVNLSGVQQQQQQLQILQLQQLMLQQLQNHGQNIQGISLPLNQNSSPSQATAIGTPTIMNAIMPQQGLQLNSVMDLNSLHPCLSPVAQGYQSQLAPAAAQLQHISPALTVQQMTPVHSCGVVGVVQNGSVQNLMQAPSKHLQAGLSLQPQQLFSDPVSQSIQNPIVNSLATPSHESHKIATAQAQHPSVDSNVESPVTAIGVTKPCQLSKPKPKSKSKKSESKKIVDPESERNEEDIAATVQQILAQAVQQQKELSLAAKNQPPPPPKSKSKKSQSRSKANQAAKEHDLGKLLSISDDVAIPRSEDMRLKEKSVFETSPNCSGLVESNHFTLIAAKSSQNDVRQSLGISQANHIIFPSPAVTPPHSSHPFNGPGVSSPAVTSFVEQTLSETSFVNITAKKSSISLKDHLSSIILKDKDGNSKKTSVGAVQKQWKGKSSSDPKVSHTTQPTAVISGDTSFHWKTQRKSIK